MTRPTCGLAATTHESKRPHGFHGVALAWNRPDAAYVCQSEFRSLAACAEGFAGGQITVCLAGAAPAGQWRSHGVPARAREQGRRGQAAAAGSVRRNGAAFAV